MDPERFVEGVLDRYQRLSAGTRTSKGARASRAQESVFGRSAQPTVQCAPVGHPEYAGLELGEVAAADLAVVFLDMRAMTSRSFWEPIEEVTWLTVAVLGQVAEIVIESGGHVLGLRGDGLMAGWGGSGSDPETDVYLAMAAAANSLDAVRGALNGLLTMRGQEPVQICAGGDWGEVCFSRSGTQHASEVNVVGHPANFAAKCEKKANSWEVVIGEGAANRIGDKSLLSSHSDSPRTYTSGERQRLYHFYMFGWNRILREAVSAIAEVGGKPTKAISVTF